MASQFKNRLVGVTILVASVVIFLPSIIDGKKTIYKDEFVSTPIKPQVQEHLSPPKVANNETGDVVDPETVENPDWEIEEFAETVTVDQTPQEKEVIQQAEPVKTEVAVTKPVATKQTAKVKTQEKAWTIQLGAFQNAANINQLLKKLNKAGYQAHTIPTDVIDGELTRVFVGPNVSKSKLEKQLPQLKRLTKLQGKLLAFDAVNP